MSKDKQEKNKEKIKDLETEIETKLNLGEVKPLIENSMQRFLGVTISEINEDISNKLIQPRINMDIDTTKTLKQAKQDFKRKFLLDLLQRFYGNVSKVAEIAQLDRRSIHRLVKKFGLNPNHYRQGPFYFNAQVNEQYIKNVVKDILQKYDITKMKVDELEELDITKTLAEKIPETRISYEEAKTIFEKEFLMQALQERSFDLVSTAKDLDVAKETLIRKMKEHRIKVE